MPNKIFLLILFLLFGFYAEAFGGNRVSYFDGVIEDSEKLQEEVAAIYDPTWKTVPSNAKDITRWILENALEYPEATKVIFRWLDKNPDSQESQWIHPYAWKKLLVLSQDDKELAAEIDKIAEGKDINILSKDSVINKIVREEKSYPNLVNIISDYAKKHPSSPWAKISR